MIMLEKLKEKNMWEYVVAATLIFYPKIRVAATLIFYPKIRV
jgi:hypothetical protein